MVEILFNPLNYKLNDCYNKTPSDKFKCSQLAELCCHAHSNEERKQAIDVLESSVPKQLPHPNEGMQYYLEILPDYTQKRPEKEEKKTISNKKKKSKGEESESEDS